MVLVIIAVFTLGYILIALEHPVKINKTATALVTGVLCWTLYAVSGLEESHHINESLGHHLGEIAQILFFLMGAMTIVELIDAHQGFNQITERITTRDPRTLLWMVSGITFFLSAILDNLTTTIVMVSLLRKLIPNKEMRLFFAGIIIIAANAGGAWSPIGDVTTTMLWIGGQITPAGIIRSAFIPSVVSLLVPLVYLHFTLKGSLGTIHTTPAGHTPIKSGKTMLIAGVTILILVPVFKTFTHLPPYQGILLGLGIIWILSELINPALDEADRSKFTASHALGRIDMSSILFFLGILLAVGALQSMHLLADFAALLANTLGDNRVIITLIGVLSSIIDNVPLVAASMGMYSIETYPPDDMIWQYLAYCAGTGGSLLVIGSAAGVAAMGMEKIEFIWYLKRITLLALLGYLAGAGTFLLLN